MANIKWLDKAGLKYWTSLVKDWCKDTFAPNSNATTLTDGLLSKEDKIKLDGISAGATKVTKTSDLTNDSNFLTEHQSLDALVPKTTTVNNKPLSSNITINASDINAVSTEMVGVANGVASLDSDGKVPATQLPSYVDDVIEYTGQSDFPATGETGKIYIDKTKNLTYRWSGSQYVEISPSLALGTTASTAFAGDKGQAAYTHAVTNKGNQYSTGFYKIQTNSEGHVTGTTAVTKSDITKLGIPEKDTTYSNATTEAAGLMTAAMVTKLNGITEGANKYTLPTATSSVLGGVKSSTTGTTANRDYKVQVLSDGTMKVNVPWTVNPDATKNPYAVTFKETSYAGVVTDTAYDGEKAVTFAVTAMTKADIDEVFGE